MNYEKAELRRHEENLRVSGSGVLVMGAWQVVKLFMQVFLVSPESFRLEADSTEEKIVGYTILIGMLLIGALVIMATHAYIGLNAMRAARGKPYKKGYFGFTVLALVLNVLSLTSYIHFFTSPESTDTTMASILVDLTVIYIYFTVVNASIKIKKLKAEKQEG